MCVAQETSDVGVLQRLEGRERRGRVEMRYAVCQRRGIDARLGKQVVSVCVNSDL